MDEPEFLQAVQLGHEQLRVEFKGPGLSTDNALFARVAKAVLALANTQHGGHVIVGVAEEPDKTLKLVGLADADLATWHPDTFRAKLAPYADPVPVTHYSVVTRGGRKFAVITVEEFEEIPILCAKDYSRSVAGPPQRTEVILQLGALYVRSLGKVESVSVPTSQEMRTLITLAVQKGLRAFMKQAVHAGLISYPEAPPSMDAAYEGEVGDVYVKP
jgi:hypothetical protein